MKKRNVKKIIMISVIFVLFIVVSVTILFGTSITVTYKAAHMNFTEENGIITEVNFGGPFNYNNVKLTSEIENTHDENGNVTHIIATYEGDVSKSFIFSNEPTITIEVSDTVEYIYQFNFDETIVIKNGVLVD